MKIALLTIHFGANHGSILQSVATYKILSELGHNVEIINYIPKRYDFFKEIMSKRYSFILKLGYIILKYPIFCNRQLKFSNFLKRNVRLSKKYKTLSDYFVNNYPDIVVVGSDQVWNSDYNSDQHLDYFLNGIVINKKISYGSSFGKKNISINEINRIKPLLSTFSAISVRENSSVELLKDNGIKASLVLDPTLLLSNENWMTYMKKINIGFEKFILIYVMDQAFSDLINFTMKIKQIYKLPIVVISFNKISDKRIDKIYNNITPGEFLYIMNQSTFVVTNSYHGVLFSLNFRKEFIAIKKDKYNSRIESILNIVGLSDKFLSCADDIHELNPIDFRKVTEKIQTKINSSIEFLNNSIFLEKY